MSRPLSALQLCALRVASSAADRAASAPSRLLVLPLGQHDARQRGLIVCSAETLSGFAAAQKAAKLDGKLALDFEHNTVPGTPAYLAEKEPRAIAAWAKAVPTAAGIEYQDIEWTPVGLQAWQDKAFQDLSPAVFRRADGTVIALHSVALCRHGELDGLTIEAAAAPAALTAPFEALSAYAGSKTTESSLIQKTTAGSKPTESVLIEKPLSLTATMKPTPALIALLSALSVTLSDSATEADVEAALLEGAKKLDEMKKATAAPEGMSAKLDALTAQITSLTERAEHAERMALLQEAKAEGKVIALSAEALKLTPLTVLKELVAAAKPGEVPRGSQVPEGEQGQRKKENEVHPDELEAYAAFGLTPEVVEASLKPAGK